MSLPDMVTPVLLVAPRPGCPSEPRAFTRTRPRDVDPRLPLRAMRDGRSPASRPLDAPGHRPADGSRQHAVAMGHLPGWRFAFGGSICRALKAGGRAAPKQGSCAPPSHPLSERLFLRAHNLGSASVCADRVLDCLTVRQLQPHMAGIRPIRALGLCLVEEGR